MKATGRVLLHLQCDGSTEQRKLGLSVRTSSPAWSARTSTMERLSDGRPARSGPVTLMFGLSVTLAHGNEAEGGVNRLLVLGSTGICITTDYKWDPREELRHPNGVSNVSLQKVRDSSPGKLLRDRLLCVSVGLSFPLTSAKNKKPQAHTYARERSLLCAMKGIWSQSRKLIILKAYKSTILKLLIKPRLLQSVYSRCVLLLDVSLTFCQSDTFRSISPESLKIKSTQINPSFRRASAIKSGLVVK